jgi:hypothetical protein
MPKVLKHSNEAIHIDWKANSANAASSLQTFQENLMQLENDSLNFPVN